MLALLIAVWLGIGVVVAYQAVKRHLTLPDFVIVDIILWPYTIWLLRKQ